MKEFIAEAIRFAIIIEKKSYDLYRKAAMTVPDQAGRELFENLAREESQHIDALLREHPGTWRCNLLQRDEQPVLDTQLREPQSSRLFDQLRHALLDKRWNIDLYTTLARTFREPSICRVFEGALGIARKEFRLIKEEYLQADPPTSGPARSRRARRPHTRAGIHPMIPNKHSELFFSMLDSGRQSQIG